MLLANVGSSVDASSRLAGKEAAIKAKKNLKDIKLAFVYSSTKYNQRELLTGISEELSGVPLIGNTSFSGIITQEGFISSDSGFVGIMALSDSDLTVGVAGMTKYESARLTGNKVAVEALKSAGKTSPPDYFYMIASPGEEELYLEGITEVIGNVPCFGGSSADDTECGEWKAFTNKSIFIDGVAVVFFYTKKPFINEFSGEYKPSDKSGIVTKVRGLRTVVEIDGIPALKKYSEWTGIDINKLVNSKLLSASILCPLGLKNSLGETKIIYNVISINSDLSINLSNNIYSGSTVTVMNSSLDTLINSSKNVAEKLSNNSDFPIAAYHFIHSGRRKACIEDRINEVAINFKEIAGDVPFITEFSFGEYGFDGKKNKCGSLMLSFSAFGK